MLKKLFISVFPEIEKISQNLGPNLTQYLWKIEFWWKGASDPENLIQSFFGFFVRYYDAEEVIRKRISWNWENILKSGPKFRPKIMKNWNFDKRCIGSAKPHTIVFRFFARCYDAEEVIQKRIPEIEKISQYLGLNLGQKWWKIESLMKRCIGSAKPHKTVFRFFARYYEAEEVIRKRISWNLENISKSGPKINSIIMKNWIFDKSCIGSAKPHTIVFRFFARYYDAEEGIHKRISWNWENISKSGPKFGPKMMYEKLNFDEKVYRFPQIPHTIVFRFLARYYDAEEVIHKLISWNWENIFNIWA